MNEREQNGEGELQRKWGDDEWNTLIYTIKKNNCILMLGPDASLEEVNGEFRPLAEILANELAGTEKIKPKIESHPIDHSNLARVAHYYYMEAGRSGLESKVEDFYKDRENLTSELHDDLAALPFYFTITSSPDRMFYNALARQEIESGKKKKPVIEGYNFSGETPGMVTMGTVEEPLLFNLYGRIEESYSLVLTENDLVDFLVAVVSGNPPLPKNVISELQKNTKSFLFLGFGFKHWYLRVLIHVLQASKKKDISYALEQFPQNEEEFQRTILYFKDCKIRIYDEELKTFVKELRKRYEETQGSGIKVMKKQPSPKVFICHASEDKDFAGFLYEKLEQAGFKPWLDKESLRGGDEWDEVIEKAIEKEINYVVILQSKALAQRIEGYVYKEINMSLDRQDKFRRGIRFIIPVKNEQCDLLEELEHIHTIDLSGKKNVEQLIKTIRRDQIKRKGDQR